MCACGDVGLLVVAVDSVGWLALSIVIVVTADERESNTLSASRVATTRQVPTLVKLKSEPETEHEAVPASESANNTVPDPEPPEVVNVIGVPYVPLTEVTTSVACVALMNVSVPVTCFCR